MNPLPARQKGSKRQTGWLVVAPTLLITASVLVFTESTAAVPDMQPRELITDVLFQEQIPVCQSCHPDEYEQWKVTTHASATLDPVFQEQLAKSPNQEACLACHTTGFDTGSGSFLSEGVTCEACHGPYKEGHPAAETMQLPMASDTCRMCHLTTFVEWETSQHAAQNIECFDCHTAHTQGLRTGSQETLCASCHPEQQTELAHATHGINGLDCASCHMSAETTVSEDGQKAPGHSHGFDVAADTCARCHEGTIHSSG